MSCYATQVFHYKHVQYNSFGTITAAFQNMRFYSPIDKITEKLWKSVPVCLLKNRENVGPHSIKQQKIYVFSKDISLICFLKMNISGIILSSTMF